MKTKQINPTYQVWMNWETMHSQSIEWLSELRFMKDEEMFFDDLVKSYTLQLIDSKHFKKSKEIVEKLAELEKETADLIAIIVKHEIDLKIMVDGIDQLEKEEAYKRAHGGLVIIVNELLEKYRGVKKQLFKLIKGIMKEGKQKRLLQ